jgi:hypothetical protein
MAKDPAERQQGAGEFAIDAAGAVEMTAPVWATRIRPHTPERHDEDEGEPVARGASAAVAPERPAATADGYHEPVYFQRRHRRGRSWVLWTVGVLLFIAAPVALLLVLIGSR